MYHRGYTWYAYYRAETHAHVVEKPKRQEISRQDFRTAWASNCMVFGASLSFVLHSGKTTTP